MNKAAQIAENAAKTMAKSFNIAENALKAVGAGFVAGLTFDVIKTKIEGVISSAAGLSQIAQRTGATVEALSGLAGVAKLSGTDVDSLAIGLQKLSKSSVDAQDGGKKTAAAFEAIGISVADLKGKGPEQIFELIARRQGMYADSVEKTAIMQALLGKAGANLLPVMKDVADVGDLQVKVTKDQAEMAERYEKNLKRLDAAQGAIFKTIAFQVLPVMDAFTKALLESATQADGVKGAVNNLAKDGSIKTWARDAALFVAYVVDAFDGLVRVAEVVGRALGAAWAAALHPTQAIDIGKQFIKEVEGILGKSQFSDRVKAQFKIQDDSDGNYGHEGRHEKKTPNYKPNSAGKESTDQDAGATILRGYLKFYDEFIADEKKLLQEREQYIDFYQRLEYTTVRDAVEQKESLIKANLVTTQATLDAEQAMIKRRLADPDLKPKERAADEILLQEVIRRRANVEIETSKQIIDGQMKLLEIRRQFDLATRERERQDKIANESAQFAIDLMGKNTLEVLKANEARRIQLDLNEKVHQLQKKLGPDADVSGEVAAAAIQAARSTALIEAAYNKQRDAIFGAHEALRQYIEAAGNSGALVGNLITDGLKGTEDMLVNLFNTGKLGWHSLEQTILTGILRIIAQQQLIKPIAEYLQGGMSNGTGAGGLFASAMSALGIGGKASTNVPGGSGWGMDLGLDIPGLASGGPVNDSLVRVNEQGPEVLTYGGNDYLMGAQGGRVTPNAGGRAPITIIQNFPANTDRGVVEFAGAEMSRRLAVINQRYN